MSRADLNVKVNADVNQAVSSFNKMNSGMMGMATKIGVVSQAAGAAIALIKSVASAASAAVGAYAVQEQAEIKFVAALKASGNQINVTTKEMFEMAAQLQSITTVGDETIIGMQQLFVSTQKLSKEGIKDATMAALNMSVALGTDSTSAAKKLARVLEDPITNLTSLKESNIQFTKAEQEKIIALSESNRLSEAQSIILKKIENTYGGVAEAVASTDTGKITQIKNLMGDIKEGLGKAIVTSLRPAFDWIEEKLKGIQSLVDKLNGYISKKKQDDADKKEAKELNKNGDINNIKNASSQVLKQAIEDNPIYKIRQQKIGMRYDLFEAEIEKFLNDPYYSEENRSYYDSFQKIITEYGKRGDKNEEFFKAYMEAFGKQGVIVRDNYSDALREKKAMIKAGMVMPSTSANYIETNEIQKEQAVEYEAAWKKSLDSVAAFIDSNGSKLNSYQIEAIQKKINEAQNLRWQGDEKQRGQIEEIISALELEKKKLQEVAEQAEEIQDEIESIDWSVYSSSALDAFSNVSSFISQIWQNQIQENESALKTMQKQWDEYFGDLKRKNDRQADSLSMMYSKGLISAEEYQKGLEDLDKAEIDAIEEKNKKEQEFLASTNKLKEKQFNLEKANNLAMAINNGAMAITNIWATHASNPIAASILTAFASASVAAQIATISASQFKGLATGGIVTKPMYTKLGEGEGPEAVIPLSGHKLREYGIGGQSGVIYINITVENNYSAEDLGESVFRSVEKLQRVGALPNWSFA